MRKIKFAALLMLALTLLAAVAWAEGEIKVELVSEPLVCSSVELRVTAPGAEECRVQWYDENGNEISWTTVQITDGVGSFNSWVDSATKETIVVSAEIDGQTYSDSLEVEYVSHGVWDTAPTILTEDALVFGQPYTVRWTEVPGAEYYRVYLRVGDAWASKTLQEPTATFSPEHYQRFLSRSLEYTVQVGACVSGYEMALAEKKISGYNEPDPRISLTISKTQGKASEWIQFTVSAPGAERVALVQDNWADEVDGDTYEQSWIWHNAAEVDIYGKACFNGEWSVFSEMVHLSLTQEGALGELAVTHPDTIAVGSMLDVNIGHIEHMSDDIILDILDSDGNVIYNDWPESLGDYTYDASMLDPGDYQVHVTAFGEPGWEAGNYYGNFTITGQRPAAPTLTMNKTDYDFSDLIGVLISSENAEMFKLIYEGYDQDGNKVFDNGSGFTTEENDGTWNIAFRVNRGDTTVYVQARAKINGVWSNPATATVHVGPSKGVLAPVDYSIPQQVALGEPITLYIVDQEHLEWLSYSIYNSADEFVARGEIDGTGAQTIMPDLTEEGDYYLWMWPHADDWETPGGSRKSFTVVASVQNKCGENVVWSLSDDGTLTISGVGKMFSYYGDATPWGYDIKKVIVEPGVTVVGGCAFMGCNQLESVQLPEGLVRIGQDAFGGCVNLKTILLPSTVNSFGSNALGGTMQNLFCYAGTEAEAWGMNHGFTVFAVDRGVLKLPAGTKTIESEAFAGLAGNLIVEIPDSVTSIAQDAFAGTTVAFRCNDGTAAASFAQTHNIPRVPD